MLIGGLMIPFKMLPGSIKPFAKLLPSTHSMNLLKTFAYETEPAIQVELSFAVLAGFGAAAILLSILLFRWDNKKRQFK
jgi:ABC-type multidrug transport system permease subunit